MCNHYRNDIRKANLSTDIYGFEEFSETKIRFDNLPVDVYPDRPAMIGRKSLHGRFEFVQMRWGFPPPDKGPKKLRTNTRRLHLPFWQPWLGPEYRCLVPFTSFAEWVEGPDGKPVEKWFAPPEGRVGYIAGFWRPWTGTRGTKADPVTGDHLLFSFMTRKPNPLVGEFHDRMPVVLPDATAQEAWLTVPANAVGEFKRPPKDPQLVILEDEAAPVRSRQLKLL